MISDSPTRMNNPTPETAAREFLAEVPESIRHLFSQHVAKDDVCYLSIGAPPNHLTVSFFESGRFMAIGPGGFFMAPEDWTGTIPAPLLARIKEFKEKAK